MAKYDVQYKKVDFYGAESEDKGAVILNLEDNVLPAAQVNAVNVFKKIYESMENNKIMF